jgi:hypothetical protein
MFTKRFNLNFENMNNLKKIILPLFFVFGIALAGTATQTTKENAPKSTNIDKIKVTHIMFCTNGPSCNNSAHQRGPNETVIN